MKLIQRDRRGRFARIWADTSDPEHTCHVHPLGLLAGESIVTYWCGHTCEDRFVCRPYMAFWLLTHPLAVVRKYTFIGRRYR